MPLIPEEPQIHESVTGPLAAAGGTRTPQAPRPVPVPGPRPGPRPAPPRATRNHPAPGRPGPARPAEAAAQPAAVRADGSPRVQLVPATPETAVSAADDAVDVLLDSGRAPSDILVLTSGDQHPWTQHELSFGADTYWRQQDEGGDVFYAEAGAERLAGRPVVVLAWNGGTDEVSDAALTAALARAGELLVLCGDTERMNTVM